MSSFTAGLKDTATRDAAKRWASALQVHIPVGAHGRHLFSALYYLHISAAERVRYGLPDSAGSNLYFAANAKLSVDAFEWNNFPIWLVKGKFSSAMRCGFPGSRTSSLAAPLPATFSVHR
ncbi:MAG: hypothetical protein R3C56_08290 [Pirellulaceae bacterium]